MKRSILQHLIEWKNSPVRMPLLLRGARQVGKTHIVETLGQEEFANLVTVNFELQPECKASFSSLDPAKILPSLEGLTSQSITPGKTLLFLDEIQECPEAIMALRYFKEKLPSLHVIGAGSLLEFILNSEGFRMPVGRVQFLNLHPLSFREFLLAANETKLDQFLKEVTLDRPFPPELHEKCLKLVREYMALGGMPAVLDAYFTTRSTKATQKIQSSLLATYRSDFGKYSKAVQHKYLELVFTKSPGLVAQWFKYSKVDPEVQVRDIKNALHKLVDAGLLYLIYATSASSLPLVTTINEKKFKLLFLDIGLLKRACQLDLQLTLAEDPFLVNQGALVEQFVGQELIAYSDPSEKGSLFFWLRENAQNGAEVDYVTPFMGRIVPIEVKAGATGKLKSLKLFMEEKNSSLGIRIYGGPLQREQGILSVPFYLIQELPRLIELIR